MSSAHSREGNSEISEITVLSVGSYIGHFAASVVWGGLAGTCALFLWPLLTGQLIDSLGSIFSGVFFVGAMVTIFTLAGMIVIGLPTTFLMRALGTENRYAYAAIGAIAGFIALGVMFEVHLMHLPEMLLFPASGAVAGFAAALRWGCWRGSENSAAERRKAEKPSNPIHDLIH